MVGLTGQSLPILIACRILSRSVATLPLYAEKTTRRFGLNYKWLFTATAVRISTGRQNSNSTVKQTLVDINSRSATQPDRDPSA